MDPPPVTAEPKVGDKMPDGSVYVGVSPETGEAMYATPADAPLSPTFNEATDYAARLDAHGHKDWRVPTKAELNVLFNNRAAIGGFRHNGIYWSSTQDGSTETTQVSGQLFSVGYVFARNMDVPSTLRCVR